MTILHTQCLPLELAKPANREAVGLDQFAEDLAATTGSSLVGYDGGTVQDVLDTAKSMQGYTQLDAYEGRATGIRLTEQGVAGNWQVDSTDTTTPADISTVRIDGAGRRVKRLFNGALNGSWFGLKPLQDNTLQLIDALQWLHGGSNRSLAFDGQEYPVDGRVTVSINSDIRNATAQGFGTQFTFDTGAGIDIVATGTGLVKQIKYQDIRLRGGQDQFVLKADNKLRFIYDFDLSRLQCEAFDGDGIRLEGNVFEGALHHCSGGANALNTAGYGIHLLNAGSGIISSIDIFGGTWRNGKHGLYVENPVQDFNIFGGTYLLAKNEGVKVDNAVAASIHGVHVENNWADTAAGAGGAGMRVTGSGVITSTKGWSSSGNGQKYALQITATSMTIIGGVMAGSNTDPGQKFGKYQFASASSELILVGATPANYDAVGVVTPTLIGTKVQSPQTGMLENFLSYNAIRTPNLLLGSFVRIGSLTGDITIENPTGVTATGSTFTVEVIQDATGGRTITWGSDFATGITAIDGTAFKSSRWTFVRSAGKWKQTAFASTF